MIRVNQGIYASNFCNDTREERKYAIKKIINQMKSYFRALRNHTKPIPLKYVSTNAYTSNIHSAINIYQTVSFLLRLLSLQITYNATIAQTTTNISFQDRKTDMNELSIHSLKVIKV